jgi:hypothetical protein
MIRAEVREPGAVLLRQAGVLAVVTTVLVYLSRRLDGSFASNLDSGTFVALVVPLVIVQVTLAVVPFTAVARFWKWGRWPLGFNPIWPVLGVVLGSAMFACAYLPSISEVAPGSSVYPTNIRSPLRALLVPGFLLAAGSAINVTPERWRALDFSVKRRSRRHDEPDQDVSVPLIVWQLGVMVGAIILYWFVVDLAQDGQLGATHWLTFVMIGAVASMLVGAAGAIVVGLPLRFMPTVRRWWFGHRAVFPFVAAGGFLVLAVSALPGLSRGEMGEEPYVWLWLPETRLPLVAFALIAVGTFHTIPPGEEIEHRGINWTASIK